MCVCVCLYVCVVQDIEKKGPHILSDHPASELHPSPDLYGFLTSSFSLKWVRIWFYIFTTMSDILKIIFNYFMLLDCFAYSFIHLLLWNNFRLKLVEMNYPHTLHPILSNLSKLRLYYPSSTVSILSFPQLWPFSCSKMACCI